jgi:hypothetical protein
MADIKQKYGTTTALTMTLNSLAGGATVTSSEVDNASDLFIDVMIELVIADIVEAGNQQVVVFASSSVDGTNFASITANNLQNLAFVGAVPMNDAGPWRSRAFSLAAAFGGFVPPRWRLIALNDNSTTALAGSGNSVQYRGLLMQSV